MKERLTEQLAARDLDPELALQAEHDVQEVDGLRAQVREEGRRRDDLVLLEGVPIVVEM
jgi:hypothetical protein